MATCKESNATVGVDSGTGGSGELKAPVWLNIKKKIHQTWKADGNTQHGKKENTFCHFIVNI